MSISTVEETVSTASTVSMEESNPIEPTPIQNLRQASSERLEAALSEQKTEIPQQDSGISGLGWLKLDKTSSTVIVEQALQEQQQQNEQNMRVQLYQPPTVLQAIVEESKIGLTPPVSHQAQIEAPKVELLSELAHKAVVEQEAIPVGIVTESVPPPTTVTTTTRVVSDEDGDQSNKDTYESFEDTNDTLNSASLLPAVDSRCCTNCVRERETQTKRMKPAKRDRVRIVVNSNAQDAGKSSNTCLTANSSDCISSEANPRKLAIKTQNQSTFKQRQLDLHRHKILVEQRRLELLELKIARERDEMLRDTVLYEKELEIKAKQLRKLTEDRMEDI